MDPDPHLVFRLDLDPGPHKTDADPKHWVQGIYVKKRHELTNFFLINQRTPLLCHPRQIKFRLSSLTGNIKGFLMICGKYP